MKDEGGGGGDSRRKKKGDRRDLVSAPAFLPFLDPISAEEKERQAFQPFFFVPPWMNISPEQGYVECAILAPLAKKVLFRTMRTSLAAGKASEALPFFLLLPSQYNRLPFPPPPPPPLTGTCSVTHLVAPRHSAPPPFTPYPVTPA